MWVSVTPWLMSGASEFLTERERRQEEPGGMGNDVGNPNVGGQTGSCGTEEQLASAEKVSGSRRGTVPPRRW